MAETTQVKILVPGNQSMVALLGQRDELLKVIEDAFVSEILVRGNEIIITGAENEAERVGALFGELLSLLDRGHELTPSTVARTIDMIEREGVRPSEVMTEVLHTSRGRSIAAKTVGQKNYVDAIRRSTLTLAIGPAGTGKCIAAGSMVPTDRGMIEIQRLAESLPAGGIAPLSVSISGVDGIEETSHLYHAGETDTLRVWTQLGFSIEATPEHPLLALAENGELVWRRADQLQPGDTLALQRGQRLFGRRTSIDFQYVRSGHDNTSKPVVLEELDLDLAYVMGVLTGDGCLSFGNRVILSTADPELAEAFERIAARFGLHVFPNGRGRPYDHIIQSAQLKALFAHLGMSTGTARTKVIPRSILEAPEAIVAAFLRGLFDADGSVEARDGRITLSSVSEDLIRQVQIVLLNLGIVSGRTLKRGTYGGRPHVSQLLTINGAEADRFASLVGIGLERKRRLLRAAKRNTNIDVVPNVSGLLREAIGTARFARADHRLFQDYRVTRRRPSPAKLRQLVGVLEGGGASGPALDTLRLLGDGRQLFLSIVGIERSRADVYDLTVPETHSFVANGFVNHNTYLAVATAVKALQEREVSRIILTRPAVEAGERLGFLPGTLYEKIDPYLKPLYDALYEMMDADAFQRLMARGTVEVAPLAYMRGRTLNDSFIILDEAQNTSPEQMKMFLTRLGFGSKAVVNGDVTQIDLPAGQQSGLVVVEEILEDIEAIEFVHLGASDVVRHKIVQDIVEAYRRYGERTPKKAGEQR